MNSVLRKVMEDSTPKINKVVVDGAAKPTLQQAPQYVDDIISSTVATMTDIGLDYHGWRKVSALEEFNKFYTNPKKKVEYDLARSDFTLIEFNFSHNGVNIPRYIYLPFANDGNLLKISDTFFHIEPVLSDTVISPSYKELFARLLKDKLTFFREYKNVLVDGEKVPGQIIHSNTYRLSGRKVENILGTAYPSISLYLLGEVGLKKSLSKYGGISNFLVTNKEVTPVQKEIYRVYSSTMLKPKGLKEFNYIPHNVKILIKKDEIQDSKISFLDNFIIGIIYVLDTLPSLESDMLELLNNHDVKNEKIFWRLALGRILFTNGYSVTKMMSEMSDHFNGLQNYIDNIIKVKLKDIGVHVDTFFDLIAVILERYNTWLLNSKEHNSDISNRYIDINYYILYDIMYGMHRALFDIDKNGRKRVLLEKEIITIFNDNITIKKIYNIIKSSAMNLAIRICDYSGDLKYSKITSQLADQSQGNGVKRGNNSQFPESTKTLRGHDLSIGSLMFLTKSAPSPRFRMNIFSNYDINTGKLLVSDEIKSITSKLDDMLMGKATASESTIIEPVDSDKDLE